MKKIILASTSPRRRDILRRAGIDFEVVKPSFNETDITNKSFSYELVENIAINKGLSVLKAIENNAVIVSADTVVVFDNIILGKPRDYDDAKRMLKMLSGNTHKVVTALCVINCENSERIVKSETSEVTFNDLTIEMMDDYITKFKPYDKAGSYGIQELENDFIKEIKGDYDNIVGLPIGLLTNILNQVNT